MSATLLISFWSLLDRFPHFRKEKTPKGLFCTILWRHHIYVYFWTKTELLLSLPIRFNKFTLLKFCYLMNYPLNSIVKSFFLISIWILCPFPPFYHSTNVFFWTMWSTVWSRDPGKYFETHHLDSRYGNQLYLII